MISGINSNTNILQLYGATKAFAEKAGAKPQDAANEVQIEDKAELLTPFGGNVAQKQELSTNEQESINKIKDYVSKYEDIKINDEDISYALKYGRSVLVNYSA